MIRFGVFSGFLIHISTSICAINNSSVWLLNSEWLLAIMFLFAKSNINFCERKGQLCVYHFVSGFYKCKITSWSLCFTFTCSFWESFALIHRISHTADWLAHFIPLISFYTPWKHQKTSGFLIFSWGIERHQWHETG